MIDMNTEGKKISFGFINRSKKSSILLPVPKKEENVELIDCLEGAEIKVKSSIVKHERGPLVIPMKGNAGNIVNHIEPVCIKSKKLDTKIDNKDTRPDSELTIEELAARQLLKEARNRLAQGKDTTKVHTLLLTGKTAVEDGKESSMDDYDNVPIEDFGLALLRGMGWNEEMSNRSKFVTPNLRPKGLGLGGQKIVDVEAKDVFDENGEKLVLKEGAFAKIVAGPNKSTFCEVQFCDQWTGRVSVKTSKTNEILMLNELFVVPVTKREYILGSKVINNAMYEKYKESEAYSNEEESIDRMKGSRHTEEKLRDRFDSHSKKPECKPMHTQSPTDRNRIKVENESLNETVCVKDEVSSDDEYEKEGNEPRNNTKELRKYYTGSSSKNK